MANANQVIVNGETILDLRSDTVTPETLQRGYTAHDKSGTKITGTLEAGGGKEEEAVTVPLDMASGDQIVTPSEGKTLSQVTITRPDDLISRRVVLGSNIGGVDGNYFAPEIWVLNEEIKVPAKALTFTDLAFFTYATNKRNPDDPFPIQTTLRVAPTGKVGIASRDAAGDTTYIKRPTATSSGFYTDANGWYGESAHPQIGRIMVFLQPTRAAGFVHNWLQENAVLFGGNTIATRKKSLFELGDVDFVKVLNVTENGTYSIEPNAPYSTVGGADVTVNVPVPAVQDSKAVTITSNGTVSVTPDAPYDALKKVDVTVDVPKIDYNTIASTWEKHDFDFNDFEGTEISATGTATGLFAVLGGNDTTSFIVFTAGNSPAGTAPQLAIGSQLWSFNAMDNGVSIESAGEAGYFFNATPYIYIQTT